MCVCVCVSVCVCVCRRKESPSVHITYEGVFSVNYRNWCASSISTETRETHTHTHTHTQQVFSAFDYNKAFVNLPKKSTITVSQTRVFLFYLSTHTQFAI